MTTEMLTKSATDEVILVNITEECVRRKVKEALLDTDICHCHRCELNVCAIVLNKLAPKYVTTQKGHLLASVGLLHPDYQMNLNLEVSRALKIVKERPLH